eukprot:TRINITY_DN70585_c0_g1_i1.p1 TRINITY_DN70585_c0_g1~~TRINITY_DN70585_c0_g1_i1.p1  ORF type:complete len:839 (-),score=61.38 TRINITY_DN70585_c0_g1_i1:253-2769(-)
MSRRTVAGQPGRQSRHAALAPEPTLPGLRTWLAALGLESYKDACSDWACSIGATSLKDVADNIDELRHILPLKPLEARRLEREGESTAMGLFRTSFGYSSMVGGASSSVDVDDDDDIWDAPPPAAPVDLLQYAPAYDYATASSSTHDPGFSDAPFAGSLQRSYTAPAKSINSRGPARTGANKRAAQLSKRTAGDGASETSSRAVHKPPDQSESLQAWDAKDSEAIFENTLGRAQTFPSHTEPSHVNSSGKGKQGKQGKGKGKAGYGRQGKAPPCDSTELAVSSNGDRTVFLSLRVHPTAGAGLSLLWFPGEGYEVSEIETRPGQDGLLVGDKIVAIGRFQLHSAASEAEVERRFGAGFCDGAKLEVLRSHEGASISKGLQKSANRLSSNVSCTESASSCLNASLLFEAGPQAAGAGLSLIWFRPEGYLVEDIEKRPGQPELQRGDLIRSIEGSSLSNADSEDSADAVFSQALRSGARLSIYRPSVSCTLGDIVSIPTALPGESLWLPSLGVGTWSWGNSSFDSRSAAAAVKADKAGRADRDLASAFHCALDRGAFLFDSAPTYGRGVAEQALGYLTTESGRYAVVATKYFPRPADNRDLPSAVIKCAREAARRLQLRGPVDLLQLHKPADPPISLETQADALAAAVQAGAARAVGVCNFSLQELMVVHERLRSAHGIHLSTCQVEFSLLRQHPLVSGLIAGCHDLGIAVLAYSPLAMGRLSGRYDPLAGNAAGGYAPKWGHHGDQNRPFGATLDNEPQSLSALVGALTDIGRQNGGRTPAQVALNWVLSQGVIALAGCRRKEHSEENCRAMGWRLSWKDVSRLAALGREGSVSDFQHG